jgi:Fic family protein
MSITLDHLTDKKKKLDALQPLPQEVITNLDEWYKIELTYTSNAIEGNTLSRSDTALVVEKGITIGGKTMREHLEAINHAKAWEFIKPYINKKRNDVTQQSILDIHRTILQNIDDANAGTYRAVSVRIAGSTVVLPNAAKVPELMGEFIQWLHSTEDHPVSVALEAHHRFVSIHPFIDGNGRTGRLLMNLFLMQEGYPPAVIQTEERKRYIDSIEKAQLGEPLDDFQQLIYEAVDRSLDVYLDSVER